jgi:signal transduction histidine kinase
MIRMTRALDSHALPAARRPTGLAPRRALTRLGRVLGFVGTDSLSRRFLIASFAVLLVGGLTIGIWVGSQLERGIIDRTASITGLYVQSFIAPHLESMAAREWLSDEDKGQLDALLTDTTFGERIVALKVWRPDGVIIYSPDRALIGAQFPVEDDLAAALGGTIVADMSSLEATENVSEQARGFNRLLEMYLPVRERGGGRIIAVAEFYQQPAEIDQEVLGAQLNSWLVVAAAVALAYLLLYGIVRQGSDTIVRQQRALRLQVSELSTLLEQNEHLRERVRGAAERTTTLGERNMRRISSDLHDGPGQMLALAMLRLDNLRARSGDREFNELKGALTDALRDMRSIAAGLRLPELDGLSTADVARRAVDDHARRSGTRVDLTIDEPIGDAALPTKIALFRALQELLSNSTRHGEGKDVAVNLSSHGAGLQLTVSDAGPGFDPARIGAEGHLGLAGIREQAELLGGTFEVAPRGDGAAGVGAAGGRGAGAGSVDAESGGGSGANGGVRVTVSWPR